MSVTTQLSDEVPITVTIVRAVADVTGGDPRHVPVLQDVVDVDALRALVTPHRRDLRSEVVVRFEVAGCTVEVSSEGSVTVMDGPRMDESAPLAPMDAQSCGSVPEVSHESDVGTR